MYWSITKFDEITIPQDSQVLETGAFHDLFVMYSLPSNLVSVLSNSEGVCESAYVICDVQDYSDT